MQRRLVVLLILLAAVIPYLPTLNDYFVQDDFGVVGLLSSRPLTYFPRWFVIPWMENIWGYTPDEIRPFTAVTYVIAALFGAGSPVPNHVINIGFHALNAWLVFRVAETAAGLALAPAAFAALVFAVLPMQTESVAWITGRVDSMPACFYLASFLLYARWRNKAPGAIYWWSVALFFVALFTKQNAVTLPVAIVLFDVIVKRRPIRFTWIWVAPYIPYAALTIAFLALRYALFGEMAREGALNAGAVDLFVTNLAIHLKRMVFGEAGLRWAAGRLVTRAAIAAAVALGIAALAERAERARMIRAAVFFLIVWIALGAAPTIVAGYGSPRHMYLASAGWAITLGIVLHLCWHARPQPAMKLIGGVVAAAVLVAYAIQLRADVRLWRVRAHVSHRIVADVEREAAAAPRGSIILIDPPRRSADFIVPHAFKPPFTHEDVTARVAIVSHSSIHCCPAHVWEPYTRDKIRTWMADASHPPAIVLRWDPGTGELFRVSERDDPFVRTAIAVLLEAPDVTTLDRMILNVTQGMATAPAR